MATKRFHKWSVYVSLDRKSYQKLTQISKILDRNISDTFRQILKEIDLEKYK